LTQILENIIRFKWGALPEEQREGIKVWRWSEKHQFGEKAFSDSRGSLATAGRAAGRLGGQGMSLRFIKKAGVEKQQALASSWKTGMTIQRGSMGVPGRLGPVCA
jgi:hypothetical protein